MDKYLKIKDVYEKNGFDFNVFENRDELLEYLGSNIDLDRDITVGGSMTIDELGLYEKFKDRGNKIFWHWKDGENSLRKEVYLTSSNAITEDGKLVNIDGVGNRVTSMIVGYEEVYVIVGENKLTRDYEAAIDRIKNIAAPLNAKRLNVNTPCVKTGKCEDCNSPDRICRAETIIHRNPSKTKIKLCLIKEELGY